MKKIPMFWLDEMEKILFQSTGPTHAQIEINNACNLDCIMCPRHQLPIDLKEMDFSLAIETFETLKKIGIHSVDLGGWGELSYHSRFLEILESVSRLKIDFSFTSNGLLLDENKIEKILDLKPVSITLSMDSLEKRGRDFTGHINSPSWKKLTLLCEKSKSTETKIRVNTLIQKANYDEIEELIGEVDRLGVYMHVLFGPNIARDTQNLRVSFAKELELYNKIEHKRRTGVWKTIVTTPLGRYKEGKRSFYFLYGLRCPQTWNSFYINQKGWITPCTLLPDFHILHIHDVHSQEQIWQHPKYRQFRYQQIKICNGCDALKFEKHG